MAVPPKKRLAHRFSQIK